MAIDIRATVTCSLGSLISASISDDYLQGSGLIKTKGNCEINGIVTPAIGTIVTFSYTQGGVTRNVPRKMRVLSSFADPFRRITKVELGCKLTYLSNLAPAPEVDGESATLTGKQIQCLNGYIDYPANSEVPPPIRAAVLMDRCLDKLAITASTNPLTNVFFIDKFDFTPGYVQVLGDLLVSESYCGYLNYNEQLQVFELLQDGGTGPVINSNNLIDLGPIGVGDLPGDAVFVRYNSIALDKDVDSGSEAGAGALNQQNWEREEVIGEPQTHTVRWQFGGVTYESNHIYRPHSITTTTYGEDNSWDDNTCVIYSTAAEGANLADKPISVVQEQTVLLAEGANSYCSAVLSTGGTVNPGVVSTTTTETLYEYDELGEVIREEVTVYEPLWKWASGLNLEFVYSGPAGPEYVVLSSEPVAVMKEVTDYVTYYVERPPVVYLQEGEIFERSVAGQRATRTTYINSLNSLSGQQGAASVREWAPFDRAADCAEWLYAHRDTMVLDDVNVSISRTRAIDAGQIRPPKALRLANNNNGQQFNARQVQKIAYAMGSPASNRFIEFSMPYQSDDYYSPSGSVVKSNAAAMAHRYGRAQNRLLLGNRSGMNVQVAAPLLPEAPFAPFVVQANGLSGLYRTNGSSWTMDSNGIVASTDALFWGAVGGSGTFWFPVAPGITTLPTTPAVVNGTMNVSAVVPVWNETVLADSRTRVGLTVQSLKYALSLLTQISPIGIKSGLSAKSILKVVVEEKNVAVVALAPSISTGVVVQLSAVDLQLTSSSPAVSTGAAVSVPVSDLAIVAAAPEQAGAQATVLNAPVTDLSISALVPGVATGAAVSVPVVDTAIAALSPSFAGATDPSFSSVGLLLHMDGANNSTTFTDSSANAHTITVFADAKISTTQFKFGDASGVFDGTGDYLRPPATSTLAFGTGDFTVECWVYFTTLTGAQVMVSYGTTSVLLLKNASHKFVATANSSSITGTTTVVVNTWYHVAMCRSGTTVRMFVNGTEEGTALTGSTTNFTLNQPYIGRRSDATQSLFGYLDDVRITKAGRYAASFTAPTSAFPDA